MCVLTDLWLIPNARIKFEFHGSPLFETLWFPFSGSMFLLLRFQVHTVLVYYLVCKDPSWQWPTFFDRNKNFIYPIWPPSFSFDGQTVTNKRRPWNGFKQFMVAVAACWDNTKIRVAFPRFVCCKFQSIAYCGMRYTVEGVAYLHHRPRFSGFHKCEQVDRGRRDAKRTAQFATWNWKLGVTASIQKIKNRGLQSSILLATNGARDKFNSCLRARQVQLEQNQKKWRDDKENENKLTTLKSLSPK